jgi:glutamate racemase
LKQSAIGIFDSGIGGLTVAHAIKKCLPNENLIYFGDTQHLPYGEKSEASINLFSKKITSFLIQKKCKAIIIACNSAASVALETVKKVAKETPVFNVIDPVINYVAEKYKNTEANTNIGIIGTKATIQSKNYEEKIKSFNSKIIVSSLQTPLLAPMIEEGFFNENISKAIINKYLSDKKLKNITGLILACTHYPLIQNEIINYYRVRNTIKRKIHVIDSAKIIAKYIAENIKNINKSNKSEYKFYVSNYTKSFEESAKLFFKENIFLEEKNLFND